jgi:hypothetical protein
MIRIDFGCCAATDNCAESYFVNKVEPLSGNLDPQHTKYPVVEKLADICYKFARARKCKGNTKGRRSNKKFRRVERPCKVQRTSRGQSERQEIDWTKNAKYNNCYAYAINKYDPYATRKRNPGNVMRPYGCNEVMEGVIRDNPEILRHPGCYGKTCPKDHYKGFLAVDKNPKSNDFHFWRQEADGYWTHKLGSNLPSSVDASGLRIRNPDTSNRDFGGHSYSESCGYFCVPK